MKKILLVADVQGWIFERHCLELKKRLPEYHMDIVYHKQNIPEISKNYDCVYILDPMPLPYGYPPPHKVILGLRNEFLYREHPGGAKALYYNGFPGRCVSLNRCKILHVVNMNQFNIFRDIVTCDLVLAQHGIDEEIFDRNKYQKFEHEGIIVSAAGRGSRNKGFGIVNEVCNELGIKYVSANYGDRRLTKKQMPNFYKGVDIHVCMSQSEGLNNPIMEAGAMGIPVISTRSGAAEEMIITGENGFLIERNKDSLKEALIKLKDKDKRTEMGNKFYEEIMKDWTWKVRIEDYRKMFQMFLETMS